MFTGSIYFKYTPNGYVVDDFYSFKVRLPFVRKVWPSCKTVCLFGRFNFTPVKGQFCKRPHKLLVWSK